MEREYANNRPILEQPVAYKPEEDFWYPGSACDVIRVMDPGEMEKPGGEPKEAQEIGPAGGTQDDRRNRLAAVKKFLYQVKDIRREIEFLERQISLREETVQEYSGKDADGKLLDAISSEAGRIRARLEGKKAEFTRAAITVTDKADKLEDPGQKVVLLKRYADLQTWEQIAADMDMTVRGVQALHGMALIALKRIMEGGGKTGDDGVCE